MTQFGKKQGPASFGKRRTGLQPGAARRPVGSVPAGGLSEDAQSFLNSERKQMSARKTSSSSSALGFLETSPSAPASKRAGNGEKTGDKPVAFRRLFSYLIDTLVLGIPYAFVIEPLVFGQSTTAFIQPGYDPAETFTGDLLTALIMSMGLQILLRAAYSIAMESSSTQATLGKMALGLVVVNSQKTKPSLGQVISRNTFGRLLSNVVPFGIGYLMALFNADKKCLHDMVSGTLVCTKGTSSASSYAEAFA